jgi:hypothetical protein
VFPRQVEGMEIYRAFADPSCLREVVVAAHPIHERSSEVGLCGEELEMHSSPCAVAMAGDDAALALRSSIQIVVGTQIPKIRSMEVQIVHAVAGSSSNSDSLYPFRWPNPRMSSRNPYEKLNLQIPEDCRDLLFGPRVDEAMLPHGFRKHDQPIAQELDE